MGSLKLGILVLAGFALTLALPSGALPSTASGPTTHPSRAEAANKAAAETDAGNLLGLLQVPPGATYFSSDPPETNPVLGEPLGSIRARTVVGRVGWWTVPGEETEILHWVEAHPPSGSRLTSVGSFLTSAPGATDAQTAEFTWPPVTGVLRARSLEVAAVNRPGGSTELRAAVKVEWTVPRPPSERIPSAVRVLDVEVTGADERGRRSFTITKQRAVRKISALINDLPVTQPRRLACPRSKIKPPTVRLSFRATRHAPPLAEAVQSRPPGLCRPMALTLRGRQQSPLENGGMVLRGLAAILR
jgi:hypothetical protein